MKKKISIGIVEDEKLQRDLLKNILEKEGFNIKTYESGKIFLKNAENDYFDILLVDYRLPDLNGLEVLSEIKTMFPYVMVIVVTAFGNIELAVKSIKKGAFDFLTKPIKKEELLIRINKAINYLQLNQEVRRLKERIAEKEKVKDFIFKSRKMENIVKLAFKIAKSNANVLLTGETGTGKEKIAEIIHHSSERSKHPLVKVNIAAIPETLIESELFGAEKGAYTGADKRMIGKFEAADNGTIFLDEISEIPIKTQAKLLRVIQDGKVIRLGSSTPIDTNTRIIAATNKNLDLLVKRSEFRDDLFYRLNVIKIELPPLRNRREDIPFLIDYFLKKYNKREKKKIEGISRDVIELLSRYSYPGNIRELENIIERGVILNTSGCIEKEEVAPFLNLNREPEIDINLNEPLTETIKKVEKKLISQALDQTGGIKTKAAELLGISERVLRYKIKQLDF